MRTNFSVAYLTCDDIWTPLGESRLIAQFRRLWNAVLDGFGNHDLGRDLYNGLMPLSHHVHARRYWTSRWAVPVESIDKIARKLCDYILTQTIGQ